MTCTFKEGRAVCCIFGQLVKLGHKMVGWVGLVVHVGYGICQVCWAGERDPRKLLGQLVVCCGCFVWVCWVVAIMIVCCGKWIQVQCQRNPWGPHLAGRGICRARQGVGWFGSVFGFIVGEGQEVGGIPNINFCCSCSWDCCVSWLNMPSNLGINCCIGCMVPSIFSIFWICHSIDALIDAVLMESISSIVGSIGNQCFTMDFIALPQTHFLSIIDWESCSIDKPHWEEVDLRKKKKKASFYHWEKCLSMWGKGCCQLLLFLLVLSLAAFCCYLLHIAWNIVLHQL